LVRPLPDPDVGRQCPNLLNSKDKDRKHPKPTESSVSALYLQ
jgi:hypothetical protein